MRKALLLSILLSACTAGFSQQGIGVRLGDPSGISYKRYSGDNALEFSIGRTHTWSNDKYYAQRFDKWYSDAAFGYEQYVYAGSTHSIPLGIQVHYLIHTDWFASEFPGLQWYYGFGGQFRTQSITHSYRYRIANDPIWYTDEVDKVTDLDIGADAVLGAEYEFEEVPIRVYVDLTLFMEIVDDPFIFHAPLCVGGRYMF